MTVEQRQRLDRILSAKNGPTVLHEVGHQIAARAVGCRAVGISIDAAGGLAYDVPLTIDDPVARKRASMVISAAGREADRIAGVDGQYIFEGSGDYGTMYRAATAIHGLAAESWRVEAELLRAERAAREIVEEHWSTILDLAESALCFFQRLEETPSDWPTAKQEIDP